MWRWRRVATAAPATRRTQAGSQLGDRHQGQRAYYDKNELRAPANSRITLTFKNTADANSGLLHNWVLVRPGTADAVANDGIAAGEANDYIKPGDNRVIVHTKMIKPGESDTITFDAPPAGTYDYICTFPVTRC